MVGFIVKKIWKFNNPKQLVNIKYSYYFFSMKRIAIQPVDLKYHTFGIQSNVKTPVILMHGLLGSKSNWSSTSKRINQTTGRTVIAVDARNHGSSPHSPEHTYKHLAADVAALMAKLKLTKASMIGHSMGGRAMMTFALLNPEVVEKLIIVDISPVTQTINSNYFQILMSAIKQIKFSPSCTLLEAREYARKELRNITENNFTIEFIVMNISIGEEGTCNWKFNVEALENNFSSDIAAFPGDLTGLQFNGPTLFIGGKESTYIPPGDVTGIKQYFPIASVVYIKSAGHMLHIEKPSEFIELVSDFLS